MFMLRRARWLAVAVVYPVLFACNDHRLSAPDPHPEQAQSNVFFQNPQLKLDILFMVDNSNSMRDKQQNLVRNFPRFMQVLQDAVPPGSKLDAHIAVVSSDLGVASDGIPGCKTDGGDNGTFRSQPQGACAGPRGGFLITNAAGNNFDGKIEDVFSCIAALGVNGCGFEHQLASVRRALGGDPSTPMPPENAGFLRNDARLGIILITDEDDCSAPPGSDLFTPDTGRYGLVDSYRCNQFGHLCGGAPPPYAVVSGLTCQSNETDSTHLIKVGEFVDFFRKLKPNPDDLRVAAITGPPGPYATHIVNDSTLDGGRADYVRILPSCSGANGEASPAVRLKEFVQAFGSAGLEETICANDFGPAMEHIANALIKSPIGCVTKRLYDTDARTAGIQADCNVTESWFRDDAQPQETVIARCEATPGTIPCWRLKADPQCATSSPDGLSVTVDHGGTAPAPNTRTTWSCRVCATADEPGCAR